MRALVRQRPERRKRRALTHGLGAALALSLASVLVACGRYGYDFPLQDLDVGASTAGGIGAASAVGSSEVGEHSAGGAFGGTSPSAGSSGGVGAGASSNSNAGGSASSGGSGSIVAGAGGSDSGGASSGMGGGALATCNDGVQNGDEHGADCGGSGCTPCPCTFGAPARLDNPNSPGTDLWSVTLSSDASTMYVSFVAPGFPERIGVSTRPDRGNTFSVVSPLPAPVTQATEGTPYLSSDGLSLYFDSARSGGSRDLYVATRVDTASDFDSVTRLDSLSSPALDNAPWVSADQLAIYFATDRGGDLDVWSATRASTDRPFGAPSPVAELNTSSDDNRIALTQDELVGVLASDRPGGAGGWDLYQIARASRSDPFSTPAPIAILNTSNMEADPALAPDGQELFFTSTRGGVSEIWRSQRTCP